MAEETTDTKTPDLSAEHAARQTEILAKIAEEQALTRELLSKKAEPEVKEEVVYTQDQLQAWVEEGKITVSQMVSYLVDQGMKRTAAQLRKEHEQQIAAERNRGTVDQKISAYMAQIPQLKDKTSDEFKRVDQVYGELLQEGHEDSLKTQLAALKIAFPENAEKPRETTGRKVTTEAAGSSGGRAATGGKKPSGNKWPDYVSQDMRELKERQIEKGMYTGMDDKRLIQELEILKRRAEKKERAA